MFVISALVVDRACPRDPAAIYAQLLINRSSRESTRQSSSREPELKVPDIWPVC